MFSLAGKENKNDLFYFTMTHRHMLMIMFLVFTTVSARRSRSDDIEDRLRSVSTNSVFDRDLSYELDDSRLKVRSLSDDNETELEFGLKADDDYLKLEYSVNKSRNDSASGSVFELRFYGMNVSGTMHYLRSDSLSRFGCTNSSAFTRCNAIYHDGLFDFQVDFSGQPFTLNGDLILSTEFKITVTVNASTLPLNSPCSLITRFSVNDDDDDDTVSSATTSTPASTASTASTPASTSTPSTTSTDDESADDDRLKPDDLYEDSLMLNVSKNIFFSFDDFVTSDDGVSALMVKLDDDRMTFHFNMSQFVWDPVVGATSSFTGVVIPSSSATTKDRVPGWGVALIVIGGVMILAVVLFLIYQAKNGKIIRI